MPLSFDDARDAQLTIAIPTYDRNEALLDNLRPLMPQLERAAGRVRLLILDNASPTPVEETLRPLMGEHPNAPIKVMRHAHNIGANANILRCFEVCDTPYLWTLSDDDTPHDDALDTIFEHIEQHPDCWFFNFGVAHNRPRKKTTITQGPVQFARALDSFGNTIFISTNVYRTERVQPNLKFGYHFMYSAVTQFIVILKALDEANAGECCLSHARVVTYNKADKSQSWSRVQLSLGAPTLLEMPMRDDTRRALIPIATDFHTEFAWFPSLLYQLVLMAVEGQDLRHVLYLYDHICLRRYYFDTSPKRRLTLFACRLLLKHHRVTYPLVSAFYKFKMKGASGLHNLDPVSKRL